MHRLHHRPQVGQRRWSAVVAAVDEHQLAGIVRREHAAQHVTARQDERDAHFDVGLRYLAQTLSPLLVVLAEGGDVGHRERSRCGVLVVVGQDEAQRRLLKRSRFL